MSQCWVIGDTAVDLLSDGDQFIRFPGGTGANYLKNYLIEHVNKEEFIFSYEWSKGDICLWDNLSILHMASEIKNCKRIMHRITIK